ncbi:MAG: helix-turn-helix domain-containing protein [Eubacteriales bacterium]
MKLFIGENIRRLRREKNVTQEKLADYLSVSTQAVSKWERGETFPDITMVLPLAGYFGVSSDELLGLDKAKEEESIQDYLSRWWDLVIRGLGGESVELITKAHKEYPNDFRITIRYAYDLIGGNADNLDTDVLAHAEELEGLCERILEECTVDDIRDDAIDILAKVKKAQGDINGAVEMLSRFPSWFGCIKGQKCEQLFDKGSEEWFYWLHKNIFDLSFGAIQKSIRSIWYSRKTHTEKIDIINRLMCLMEKLQEEMNYEPFYRVLSGCYSEIAGRCRGAGEYKNAVEYYRRNLEWSKKYDDFASSDRTVSNLPQQFKYDLTADWGSSKIHNQVKVVLLWLENNPWLEELRQDEDFRALLDEYRPFAKDL